MKPSRGFTLIEVLVALAIVAVALAAGARAASSLTDNADRLAQVLAAQWCADNQMTGLRLARVLPGIGDADFSCEQLGRSYSGKMITRPTVNNPSMRSVQVVISSPDGPVLYSLITVLSRQ